MLESDLCSVTGLLCEQWDFYMCFVRVFFSFLIFFSTTRISNKNRICRV